MSTKRLARTVIEGGRCPEHYKGEVHQAKRTIRAHTLEYLRLVTRDVEAADAVPAPVRTHIAPCFNHKLKPLYAFMDAHIGQSWNKTRSLLQKRFDIRTTAGRHIIFDHVVGSVRPYGDVPRSFPQRNYCVDANGLLQKEERPRGRRFVAPPPFDRAAVAAWLGNRKIGRCGDGFVWFVPTSFPHLVKAHWPSQGLLYCDVTFSGEIMYGLIQYKYSGRHAVPNRPEKEPMIARRNYRQAKRLNKKDEAFLRALPEVAQNEILKHAPARPDGQAGAF
jgi:hypothetical protein